MALQSDSLADEVQITSAHQRVVYMIQFVPVVRLEQPDDVGSALLVLDWQYLHRHQVQRTHIDQAVQDQRPPLCDSSLHQDVSHLHLHHIDEPVERPQGSALLFDSWCRGQRPFWPQSPDEAEPRQGRLHLLLAVDHLAVPESADL